MRLDIVGDPLYVLLTFVLCGQSLRQALTCCRVNRINIGQGPYQDFKHAAIHVNALNVIAEDISALLQRLKVGYLHATAPLKEQHDYENENDQSNGDVVHFISSF